MVYHCLFEQSGVFKNEFKKLGFAAYDYDILNDFNETDFIIDIFDEIDKAYEDIPSIFDNFSQDDYLLAFFPCVRFENQINLWFRGECNSQKKWNDVKKLVYDLELHNDLHRMYSIITKLAIICLERKIKIVIENPYSEQHYLTRYWCLKPSIIDYNRRSSGDLFKKPTQFYFLNCEPCNNFVFEAYELVSFKSIVYTSSKVERSLISPAYANRFIREFILIGGKDGL